MTAFVTSAYRLTRVVNYYPIRRRLQTTILNWYRMPWPTIRWTTDTMPHGAQAQLHVATVAINLARFWSFLKPVEQLAPIVILNAANPTGTTTAQGTPNPTVSSTGTGFTGSPGRGDDRDKTDRAEQNWTAIDEWGIECHPGMFDILHRSDNVDDLNKLFVEGLPLLPGTDFSIRNHQRRSGERAGTNDPFYGATERALWEGDLGPLSESGGRYLLLLEDVYGVLVQNRLSSDLEERRKQIDFNEMEIIFRRVPGRKILCVLDKKTGKVHANPHLPAEAVAHHVDRLKRLYQIGKNRGFLPID